MSLLDEKYEPFVRVKVAFSSDNEGGAKSAYTEGEMFQAIADFSTSSLSKIADKLAERVSCIITTSKTVTLEPMEIVKRISDGQYFRITSDGKNKKTPDSATLDMRQSTAEFWEMPNGE